mgnify:CR=1 FL=1
MHTKPNLWEVLKVRERYGVCRVHELYKVPGANQVCVESYSE